MSFWWSCLYSIVSVFHCKTIGKRNIKQKTSAHPLKVNALDSRHSPVPRCSSNQFSTVINSPGIQGQNPRWDLSGWTIGSYIVSLCRPVGGRTTYSPAPEVVHSRVQQPQHEAEAAVWGSKPASLPLLVPLPCPLRESAMLFCRRVLLT